MDKGLKILAIVFLIVTVAASGVVAYGVYMRAPQVVQVVATLTPASQVEAVFDDTMQQIAEGSFAGKVYADTAALDAQSSTFVTYTVRLKNNGFLSAEWISLDVTPVAGDILQLAGGGANVLNPGAAGDLDVTILTTQDAPQQLREIAVTCYVFGSKVNVYTQTN